jgi:hypothetical protein
MRCKPQICFPILLLLLLLQTATHAQELSCKVKIGKDKIQNTDPQVFTAMERSITEFMNTRKWTTDEWDQNERIDCNIMINLTNKDATDQEVYTATITVQAARPVFNTSYTTPLINYMDRDFVFQFTPFTQLQFDDNRVSGATPLASNLTAVLAYYAYLIIGLDYDSFAPNGGSVYFKKAQNVVNNAPEQGSSIRGWKAFEEKRNRYWIVDQILSPRFETYRKYWYQYHREGLDVIYSNPTEGKSVMLKGINTLGQLQRDNPSATLLQFFFNAKSDEIMRLVSQTTKEERAMYVPILSAIDVSNATKYNNLR